MGEPKLKILHENCDPKLAENPKLPYTAYLVHYIENGQECYDIAIPQSQVEMFDYYYDKYKKDFKWFRQSQGIVNPKLWKNQQEADKKETKNRRKRR